MKMSSLNEPLVYSKQEFMTDTNRLYLIKQIVADAIQYL
ncbi:hypothetical protein DFQ12_0792 [Sphingobacterium detergens]|uniref:Uncharacterized protein n=1 Tax=Sphingobacterium detergens TaxID=1145106 RepID=A0A420BGX7_SPHD1|nr:hypothetical protein DFQ12_0792 [Sphingobacterium detergens]